MTDVACGRMAAVGVALASVALAVAFGVDCARGHGWQAVMVTPSMVAVPALLGRLLAAVRLAGRDG